MTPEEQKLFEIWHPEAADNFARIAAGKKRFVHYTNATAAMSILRNREVWLRNTSCMNDYSEVQHGIDCLVSAYRSASGEKLKTRIDEWFPGISKEVEALFDGWQPDLRFGTYITCFSEHEDDEDILGRLSMWRAYGRNTGVAFVFKSYVDAADSDALNAWSSPVAYLTEKQFAARFEQFVGGILAAAPLLQELGRENVKARLSLPSCSRRSAQSI